MVGDPGRAPRCGRQGRAHLPGGLERAAGVELYGSQLVAHDLEDFGRTCHALNEMLHVLDSVLSDEDEDEEDEGVGDYEDDDTDD